jgi:hypothetical protein
MFVVLIQTAKLTKMPQFGNCKLASNKLNDAIIGIFEPKQVSYRPVIDIPSKFIDKLL